MSTPTVIINRHPHTKRIQELATKIKGERGNAELHVVAELPGPNVSSTLLRAALYSEEDENILSMCSNQALFNFFKNKGQSIYEEPREVAAISKAATDNNESCFLGVKRICPEAQMPTRGSAGAVGYDLYSVEDKEVEANAEKGSRIKTGLAISLPPGVYGRIAPRSGLAVKNCIGVGAGVIDIDSSAEIEAVLINHGTKKIMVNKGDRIAQLILERYETPKIVEIFSTPDTERGPKGFGSTGTGTIKSGRSADTETEKPEGKLNQLTASLTAKCTTMD